MRNQESGTRNEEPGMRITESAVRVFRIQEYSNRKIEEDLLEELSECIHDIRCHSGFGFQVEGFWFCIGINEADLTGIAGNHVTGIQK